ncbi:MAG: ECF-type sigma factor [Bacteroidota bacterium]
MDAPAALDAPARDLTRALRDEATRTGTPSPDALARTLYGDLRRIARAHRAKWRGNATMNTTALVHEAYLRIANSDRYASGEGYASGDHFLHVASRAMRQVLVNYARERSALKRGGGTPDLALDDAPALISVDQADRFLATDEALGRLGAMDARAARVVELKVFGGFTLDETADALGVSEATVTRDWRRARAWLRGELGGDLPTAPPA